MKFICEICNRKFDPDPRMMVEAWSEEEDPDVDPPSGGACICVECQDSMCDCGDEEEET